MMTQRERIAWYVMRGEMIENDSLDDAFNGLGGDKEIKNKAERTEWLIRNICPQELDSYFDFEYLRICSHCGKPMCWGYCIEGGCEYYCSKECLNQHYSDEEFVILYNKGNGDSYFTCWID